MEFYPDISLKKSETIGQEDFFCYVKSDPDYNRSSKIKQCVMIMEALNSDKNFNISTDGDGGDRSTSKDEDDEKDKLDTELSELSSQHKC